VARPKERANTEEIVKPGPCITVSRDPGSGGSEIARRLAKELGMDIIGAQIIQQVAERSDMSEKVIASLDEKTVRLMDSWLDSLFETHHISPDEYLQHLTQVIGTIGKQGNAVIVGRGAQFILPPEETFRVRFIAPRDIRIRTVMRDSGEDFAASERYIYKTESDRNAFHRKHFHTDWTNPGFYDLIVNTGHLGVEGAAAAVKAAFTVWKTLPHDQSLPMPSFLSRTGEERD
jgi:cytidylate kinase